MNLDLSTHVSTINTNINLLNEGKISWITFGYTNNNVLNVIQTGDENLEDMFEEFDSNKIMYGFLTVTAQNTQLKKNVFIYWQGEAASQTMKTMSVQHSNIIRNLLKPLHVTLNARHQMDLDLKEIMNKVELASGSNYSCNAQTKVIFEHQASVKSEGNTAANLRAKRLQELSALVSLQNEHVKEEPIGSRYEKVDAYKEISQYRNSITEPLQSPKPIIANYQKLDSAKDGQYQSFNREHTPFKSIDATYDKRDACKEMKSQLGNTPTSSITRSKYTRINPEEELRSLNIKPNVIYENKIVIKGENNTAEKAKEDRQKELSSLFSKKISLNDDGDHELKSHYSKINPIEEIRRLRKESSISSENDDEHLKTNYTKVNPHEEFLQFKRESVGDVFTEISTSYKKVNPREEMMKLRKESITNESDEVFNSPSVVNYKKINPAEEIKRLRSQGSVADEGQTRSNFQKINAMEEIQTARRLSTDGPKNAPKVFNDNRVTPPVLIKPVLVSARKSFENAHKINDSTRNNPKSRLSRQEDLQEEHNEIQMFNTNPEISDFHVCNDYSSETSTVNSENKDFKDNETSGSITAIATYGHNTDESDEISFEENEIITNIEIIDEGWWIGVNSAGKKGMFPSNLVERNFDTKRENVKGSNFIEIPNLSNQINPNDSVKVRALFDYCPDNNEDISFKEGDIITDVNMDNEDWWEGECIDGKRGSFPSNYVERI